MTVFPDLDPTCCRGQPKLWEDQGHISGFSGRHRYLRQLWDANRERVAVNEPPRRAEPAPPYRITTAASGTRRWTSEIRTLKIFLNRRCSGESVSLCQSSREGTGTLRRDPSRDAENDPEGPNLRRHYLNTSPAPGIII